MDFTFELSKLYNVLPFEIMKQDKDEVIMLINYMTEKADGTEEIKSEPKKQERIKVNSSTATGGWW